MSDLKCRYCGKPFDTFKGKKVHEASHRQHPCRHCDQMFSVRGLPRHEKWCAYQEGGGVAQQVLLPPTSLLHRVVDFLERVHEVPVGAYVVACGDDEPVFVPARNIGPVILRSCGSCIAFPTSKIPDDLADEAPLRDRRRRTT